MSTLPSPPDDALLHRVLEIVAASRQQVHRTVNTAMVHEAWFIGREIVEHEQQGEARAAYGGRQLQRLSERLTAEVGPGYSVPNLRRMRQFYLSFPSGSALQTDRPRLPGPIRSAPLSELPSPERGLFPPSLGWTHYQALLRVQDSAARRFYTSA